MSRHPWRVSRETVAACLSVAVLLGCRSAHAEEPKLQWNTALLSGLAWQRRDEVSTRPLVAALHADALFGRRDNFSWGAGPMMRLGTNGFSSVYGQAGVSLLVPVHEYLPFVVSAGPMVRRDGVTSPGAFGSVFWGAKSFNHHGNYILTGGLVAEYRAEFAGEKAKAVVVGLHLDGQVLTLPLLLIANAFR